MEERPTHPIPELSDDKCLTPELSTDRWSNPPSKNEFLSNICHVKLPNYSSNMQVTTYAICRKKRGLYLMFSFEGGGKGSTGINLNNTSYRYVQDLLDHYMINFSAGNFTKNTCERPTFNYGNPFKIVTNLFNQFYSNIKVYDWQLAIHNNKIKAILRNIYGEEFKVFIYHNKTCFGTVEELFNKMECEFLKGNFNINS